MAPTNVPGDFRIYFRAIQKRVDHVVIVLYVNIACLERCSPGSKVNRNSVFGNWDRPEQPAFRDPRIEIVNLLTRRVKNVKSYEREGAVVIASVRANKLTAHEAHIGFERKMLRSLANDGMRAHSADCSPAYEAVEVGNCGRLYAGSRQEDVKHRPRRPEQLQTGGNGKRCC